MKTIHNIFDKTEHIEKKEIQREVITIDYREKNSLVATHLIKLGFEIEFKELKVGDYLVKGNVVERKTVQDFLNSMINRHLLTQIEELQQYENKVLIIEGIDEQELYSDDNSRINANAVRGFLLSIAMRHKVPIIFSKNSRDTAKFIAVLANKKEKEAPLNPKKRIFSKKEQLQYIIESFPGIGPKTARKLLEEFKTIKNVVNATEKDLEKILGKKSEIMKNLFEMNY